MGPLRMVFRAELRRRWQSWLALAFLVAVVGGVVLAATAAGQRTATAFPRFVDAHGYDVEVGNFTPLPQVAHLPGVASVTTAQSPGSDNVTCVCHPGNISNGNFSMLSFSPAGLRQDVKLVTGRMPNQSDPDELLASFTLEQDDGVHVGSVLHISFFSAAQLQTLINGGNPPPAFKPVAMHVVGIEAAEIEFPTGQPPSYDVYTTQAFERTLGRRTAQIPTYYIRLHSPADLPRFSAALNKLHALYPVNVETTATAVAQSIHPQAIGWWVLAILAGLAGIATVGQALWRQSGVENQEYPTLSAVGLRRSELFNLGMARNAVVGVAGALGAIAVAVALSPLAPVGEARLAEPVTGVSFDAPILLVGGAAVVVVVMALGIWPALRASRTTVTEDRRARARPSVIVDRLAGAGVPPSAVIGVRYALERGRGTSTVPVGTALLGTVLAVTALCGTAVFGASLTHLTGTPALYGDAYQFMISNTGDANPDVPGEVAALKRDPAVTDISVGTRSEVSIDGTSVFAVIAEPVRGPLLISDVNGKLPSGVGQVSLGATTMRAIGAHVGSTVYVAVQTPEGGTRSMPFQVVGTSSFPGQFGLGGLGNGATFTLAGMLQAACPAGPAQATCEQAYKDTQTFAVLARTTPGAAGGAAITHFVRTFSNNGAQLPTVPTSLVNFGEAVNFPFILGVLLALFGAATLVHLLVVSVARRRREIGLLRALGLVSRQVGAAVCWQSSTVALVGVVVGTPLGVALGQTVWRDFASNLGAVPVATVPVVTIAAMAVGVLVVANVLAIAPALAATRSTPGQLLRTQ